MSQTVCQRFEEFCSHLFNKLLWLAMLEDPWRSGFHSGARMYPPPTKPLHKHHIHRCIKRIRDLFHRPPTDGSTWMRVLCLGAGNVATQYAAWRRCVSIGSCTTRVFVTTRAFTFAISARTWNWSRKQTSNSAWNSANLERRLLKWYDVRMEMRPWVEWGVSSGTHASREAEHHPKTMRVQGDLPRAQGLKMWKRFGGMCMRIVGELLRALLQ